MYRVLTICFLVVSMALAWWALELQSKLVFKELEVRTLRKERDAAQAAEKRARADIAPLQEDVARLKKERDDAQTTASASPAAPVEDVNAGLLGGLLKQMDSPEMKNMMRSQELAAVRKEYAALLKRWNLPPADAETVLNFLTDREMGAGLDALSAFGPNGAPSDLAEKIEKRQSENKERLKTLLGAERMAELESFEQEKGRADVIARYAEHLDITGSPLNPQQRTQLAELIRAETGTDTERAAAEAAEMKLIAGGVTDETIAKMRKDSETQQSRIIQKAGSILTPDQVSGLQSAFREENDEQESSMKMVKQLLKEGGGAAIGGAKVQVKTQVLPSPKQP